VSCQLFFDKYLELESSMPRLSMWRDYKSLDYQFLDNQISEYFIVGGTGIIIHKYIGPASAGKPDDPTYQNPDTSDKNIKERVIQDLLFLENRDRKYDDNVYEIRGVYNVQDNDFDLSQFGWFLSADTLYLTFHLNDMIRILGRKIMSGDVIELLHQRDEDLLDPDAPPINKFYIVQDANRASEGYSQTWWPHLWRCKISSLVDSQEFSDILGTAEDEDSLKNLISTYNEEIAISDAVVTAANKQDPIGGIGYVQPDSEHLVGGKTSREWDPVLDYGEQIDSGAAFPANPTQGLKFIRTDFKPNRLYERRDNIWIRLYDNEPKTWVNRTLAASDLTNNTTESSVNNEIFESRQGISTVLEPKNKD